MSERRKTLYHTTIADRATANTQKQTADKAEDTGLLWQTTPSRFADHYAHTWDTTASSYKITPAGSGDGFKHYAVQARPLKADWSTGKVIGRFKALTTAKEAARQHATEAA